MLDFQPWSLCLILRMLVLMRFSGLFASGAFDEQACLRRQRWLQAKQRNACSTLGERSAHSKAQRRSTSLHPRASYVRVDGRTFGFHLSSANDMIFKLQH